MFEGLADVGADASEGIGLIDTFGGGGAPPQALELGRFTNNPRLGQYAPQRNRRSVPGARRACRRESCYLGSGGERDRQIASYTPCQPPLQRAAGHPVVRRLVGQAGGSDVVDAEGEADVALLRPRGHQGHPATGVAGRALRVVAAEVPVAEPTGLPGSSATDKRSAGDVLTSLSHQLRRQRPQGPVGARRRRVGPADVLYALRGRRPTCNAAGTGRCGLAAEGW